MPGAGLLELHGRGREPEVGELHLSGVGHQHVWGRHISVHELEVAEAMGEIESASQLPGDVDRDVDGKGDLFLRAAVPHRAKILALHEVHRHVQLALHQTGVEDRDQVAVGQLNDDLGLVAKAGDVLFIGQVGQYSLDDREALEPAITRDRKIQRSHPPLGQGSQQVVLPELPREFVTRVLLLPHAQVDRWCPSRGYHGDPRQPMNLGSGNRSQTVENGGTSQVRWARSTVGSCWGSSSRSAPERPSSLQGRGLMSGETVLVIDDSPTILKVVQLVLTKAGFDVETAADGEAGLAAAGAVRPNLILLDFVMPRMNGYQVCRSLAGDDGLKDIPVVLMSAKGDQVGERFVKVMGIVDYITKPFSPEAITAVVQHTINKYTERGEERRRPTVDHRRARRRERGGTEARYGRGRAP